MSDWHVIVIDGSERATRGFVAGFVGERGVDPLSVLLAEDIGVGPESLGARIVELLTGGRHQVILIIEELAAAFADALEREGGVARLRLAESHRLVRAKLGFTVETFSRDVAQQIRTVLASLPAGVTVVERQETEETHPDEKAVDLYVSGHPYAYRASGRVTGELTGVLAVRRRLAEIEAVQLEGVHLETR